MEYEKDMTKRVPSPPVRNYMDLELDPFMNGNLEWVPKPVFYGTDFWIIGESNIYLHPLMRENIFKSNSKFVKVSILICK